MKKAPVRPDPPRDRPVHGQVPEVMDDGNLIELDLGSYRQVYSLNRGRETAGARGSFC